MQSVGLENYIYCLQGDLSLSYFGSYVKIDVCLVREGCTVDIPQQIEVDQQKEERQSKKLRLKTLNWLS